MGLSWNKFASHNEDSTSSFETLSSIIFCDTVGATIQAVPVNYPGLEAKPVKGKDGKGYGYQCKYFRGENSKDQQKQIRHSLESITDGDLKKLDTIYIYANFTAAGVEKECTEQWTKHLARKKLDNINLVWCYGLDFFINYLRTPKFEGLMSTFFGQGRPQKLHDSNLTDKFLKARSKKYYLELPLQRDGAQVKITSILQSKAKFILVQSRAGTGKSWLMNELAYRMGGHNLSYKKQLVHIYKRGVVVLLTANECSRTSVSDVLAHHLAAYGISPFDYPVTLLIDAIDEVDRDVAKNISESLNKLIRGGQIKQALVTSRTSSTNSILINALLKPNIYDIEELSDDEINDYFRNRGDGHKVALLNKALKQKVNLDAVRNIRMLETAWTIVTSLDDFSLENMFQKRFESQVNKLPLTNANLLEPIEEKLETILQKQAYNLQSREVFDFSIEELQDIVLDSFPRVNYKDTNEIIENLEKICIDASSSWAKKLQFEHRSWVDYFTARYLAKRFADDNKSAILEFAAYEDFIVTWFVPIARKMYITQGRTTLAITLGLIDWYANEEYVDWVDREAELLTDIAIAKYEPSLVEKLSDVIRNSKNLKTIKRAYESGMIEQASFAYHELVRKLQASNKIDNKVWENFVDYYYLGMAIDSKKPINALLHLQDIVELNVGKKRDKATYTDESEYSTKLVDLSNKITLFGISNKFIITNIKPTLMSYFFEYLIRPESIFLMRSDSSLQERVLRDFGDSDDSIVLQGLLQDEWSKETKSKAEKILEKVNNESHRRDFYPFAHHIRRLALLRILSHWNYGDQSFDDPSNYKMLTINEVFFHLYSTIAKNGWDNDELHKFMEWIRSEDIHFYDLRGNDTNSVKRAISDVLVGAVKYTPIEVSASLIKSLVYDEQPLYAAYRLMLEVYQYDQEKFRKIFSYNDVVKLLEQSRDDISERQSTVSDFALIVGMYSKEDLVLFATNAKRDARLRYGYRKDVMGFFLIEALRVMWKDGIYGIQELQSYTWRIYRIILRILEITDGKETHWLPNYLFNLLCEYDFDFADEVYTQYLKDYDYSDYSVRTVVILGAIRRGDSYDSIRKRLRGYTPSMLERGRAVPAYYEEQIICLAAVLKSSRYSEEEKNDALETMSNYLGRLISEAKTTKSKYRPYYHSSDLNDAAKIYRKYKSASKNSSEYSPFPYASRQDDGFSQNYKKERLKSDEIARIALAQASTKEDMLNIIDTHVNDGYGYLLKSADGAQEFVLKLEQHRVPYEKIQSIVNRAIEQHYYGKQSRLFVKALWRSSYRLDLLSHFTSSPHHSDLETILYLYQEDGDSNSVKQLIESTTQIIELLTRSDTKAEKQSS